MEVAAGGAVAEAATGAAVEVAIFAVGRVVMATLHDVHHASIQPLRVMRARCQMLGRKSQAPRALLQMNYMHSGTRQEGATVVGKVLSYVPWTKKIIRTAHYTQSDRFRRALKMIKLCISQTNIHVWPRPPDT